MTSFLVFAGPSLIAFGGVYLVSEPGRRRTLRLFGGAVLALCAVLILTAGR